MSPKDIKEWKEAIEKQHEKQAARHFLETNGFVTCPSCSGKGFVHLDQLKKGGQDESTKK